MIKKRNKNMKKISILICIALYSLQVFSQTCYVAKTDATGIDNSAYQSSLNAAACELKASFPQPFNQQFKVVEFGYYLHIVSTKDGMESLWTKMKQDAQQEAPYYLLIAKESTPQSIYERFRVSIKLPSVAPFACIDEFKLKTIEQQLELVINQKYQSFGSSFFRYADAEIEGMKKLQDIIFKYTDCCLCCGNRQSGCESCEYIDNSIAACVNNNATFKAQVENFISEHNCSEKAKDFAIFATHLICENGGYKWQRLEELYELIEANPNALLQSCSPPDPVYGNWQELASFVLSGVPLQRIQNSNGTWSVQSIQNAGGTRVNLDFFAVIIDSLPIVNGNRFTAKQLLDHFRKNINDFAPKFNPYDEPYDKDLWASENPLGTIMRIIIDAITDGDVIASQYEECCWIFTTLRGPAYRSGYHPVSGNRMFGYAVQNGQTIIYTRGADRTTTWYHGINDSEVAFEGADALWHGMQYKLSKYIKDNGGKLGAMPTYEIIHRPNWENIKTIRVVMT
jgi:hypothetical protein